MEKDSRSGREPVRVLSAGGKGAAPSIPQIHTNHSGEDHSSLPLEKSCGFPGF